MNSNCPLLASIALVSVALPSLATTLYVDVNSTNPVPPYTNWATAANVIQDAVDVAADGDTVLVTNGVYSTGGKVIAGDLTNRVVLDKPITLQSVNGPDVTSIEGASTFDTNGVRCVWMTNQAVLSGFTVQHGSTRAAGGSTSLQSGGGVWCAGTDAAITNCLIRWNRAQTRGGGIYRGMILNSTILENAADGGGGGVSESEVEGCIIQGNLSVFSGGGAYKSSLRNCAVLDNSGASSGGATCWGSLYNCTVTRNSSGVYLSPSDVVRNSIVYGNTHGNYDPHSFRGFQFQNSCTTPLPLSGSGNIDADPLLLPDGIHLSEISPCRAMGSSNYVTGVDVDGQAWMDPPSMGCDEWDPEPVVIGSFELSPEGGNGEVTLRGFAVGAEPLSYQWRKDGLPLSDGTSYTRTDTKDLVVRIKHPAVAGGYQMVVTNSNGMTIGPSRQLKLHYVDVDSDNPLSPFAHWTNAACVIQDAVDAAADGEVVVVTNGVYTSGARADGGTLSNRVVVERNVLLMSVNGPEDTVIQGAWDPATTNGPNAVRCVKLSTVSTLKGFGVTGGATALTGDIEEVDGGGVYSGYVWNCRIYGNRARGSGGGAVGGEIYNSEISGNCATTGGGAAYLVLFSTAVTGNCASDSGGGTYYCAGRNSIIRFNSAPIHANHRYGAFSYSSTTPLPSGAGNIDDDPMLLDAVHIAPYSPCRGAGTTEYVGSTRTIQYARGADLDGEPWMDPPSIGCDEVYEADAVGPLAVSIELPATAVVQGVDFLLTGLIVGRASSLAWDFGDGTVATNVSYITTHSWTNVGDYPVTFTAYNSDNPGGVGTNLVIHVLPLEAPELIAGSYDTNSTFTLRFSSQAGVDYLVEQATNLNPPVVWSPVSTRNGTGGLEQVTDSAATNAMRFYRVSVPE